MTQRSEIEILQDEFIDGRLSRRAFIGRAIALGVSLSAIGAFLAACSTSATAAPASQPPASGGDSGTIANTKVLASTGSAEFTIPSDGHPGVIVKLADGSFVAYDATCTHAGCTVAYDGSLLACPCHGSKFDPAAGASVVAGPAPRPLAELAIRVDQATGDISLAG